jgi:FMN phosphatase YigB (HAD superfamily)
MNFLLKKAFFSLILFISLPLFGKIFFSGSYSPTKLTPENTLIAFDIHDVLVQKSIKDMASTALAELGITGLIYMLRPDIWYSIYTTENQDQEWQDRFLKLTEEFPSLKRFRKVLFDVDNQRTPLPGMPELVKNLDEKGYPLYVLSNIHPSSYYGWQSKELDGAGNPILSTQGLKDKLPEIFSHFKGAATGAKKPKPQAFSKFIKTFNNDRTKRSIFIDDRPKNVKESVENGIDVAILFESPEQLKKDLNDLLGKDPTREKK